MPKAAREYGTYQDGYADGYADAQREEAKRFHVEVEKMREAITVEVMARMLSLTPIQRLEFPNQES